MNILKFEIGSTVWTEDGIFDGLNENFMINLQF